MTTIGRLPTEIVSLILQQLSSECDLYECAIVNKTWNTTATPLLWQQPSFGYDDVTELFFICLATASHPIGQHIRVVIWYYFDYEDKHLLRLIKHARSLEHLEIGPAYSITDASIEPLARSCRGLTLLHLGSSPITHISIDSLNEHCHRLSNLTFWCCPNIPSTTFLRLADCPLQEICLKFWVDENLFSWAELQEHIPDFVRFDRLTHLDFKKPSMPFVLSLLLTSQTPTTATTTTTNSKVRWPYLTHLTLTDQDGDIEVDSFNNSEHNLDMFAEEKWEGNMEDVENGFITFFQTHPHLCSVRLRGYQLGARVLEAMAAFLPKLSYLDLSCNKKIAPHDIRRLVMHCPTLTFIDIGHCGLRRDDFPEFAHAYDKIRNEPRTYCRAPSPSRLNKLNQKLINQIRGDDSDDNDSYNELDLLEYGYWWE